MKARHPKYSHLLENGAYNVDFINAEAVRSARGWMNYQAESAMPQEQRRGYLDTLRANLRVEWDRAEAQRESFLMRQRELIRVPQIPTPEMIDAVLFDAKEESA